MPLPSRGTFHVGYDVYAVQTLVQAVLRRREITACDTEAFFVDRLRSVEVALETEHRTVTGCLPKG